MSSANSARPRAEGNLAQTPFLHLVLYLYRERASGTLVIQHHGRETKVLFRDGRAVAARPVPRGSTLQPGLLPLCKLADAPYSFWEDDLLEGTTLVIKGTVDPYTLVVDSLRHHTRDDVVNTVVDRYMEAPLALQPGADTRRLGLRGQDLTLLDLLRRGPLTPAGLLRQSILPRDHARRLVYALLITKQVALADGSSSTSGVRQAVSVTPPWGNQAQQTSSGPPRSGEPAAGPTSTIPGTVSASPSARPSPSTAPGTVPAWKSLATLRPPGPGSSRPPGSPLPPRASARPTPVSFAPPALDQLTDEGKFRRVEQLAASRSFEEAGRILELLLERHPDDADYLAMRAWLLFCEAASVSKIPPVVIDAINQALRVDDNHPRALYTKAMTFKRMGRQAEAMRLFQRVTERDPKHLDAQRELRLMQMRNRR